MLQDGERQKVAHIVHGTFLEGQQNTATTIRNLLCASFPTSRTVKKDFEGKLLIKEKQTAFLIDYCKNNDLLLDAPAKEQFIARGGEAIVYLALHNIFFPFTSYQFLGFTIVDNKLMAVLK
jgi:hypothetical protein